MNPILQLLSSVEGHAKRQWLKIVAGFATLVTGWLAARLGFNDSITAPLTTAILAIGAYVFEMVSSKLANQQRLGVVVEPLQPVKEKLPGYSKVYESGKGTLTQEQQVNREACGIPSAEEVGE